MGDIIGLMARLPVLAAEGTGHGIADPALSHAAWTWVIFAIVFLVLWRVAWRPLREQLEARENRIRETVEKALQVKQEAEALLDKHRELMDRARADAQEIINEGRVAAERVHKDAAAASQREAQEMVERARREIALETRKAVDEIRREAVDLTLLAAGKVLERSLEDADHRRLTSQVIEQLSRMPGEG